MMRVVVLSVCSANVVAFLQRPANQADDATGAEGHADERPPSNDAPTSRSLMFATLPQKMTYSGVQWGYSVPTLPTLCSTMGRRAQWPSPVALLATMWVP